MRKIEVCIRGRNFLMKTDKGTRKRGFYAARFVEANDISSAVSMAMDSFRAELKGQVLNDKSDPPAMTVVDASEVYYFQDKMEVEGKVLSGKGFLWDDEEDALDRPVTPWTGNWQTLRKKIKERDLRTHSMLIHFTNALYPVAVLFMLLFLVSGKASFGQTYFYIMALATLSVPFSFVTGITEWRKRYQGAAKRIFYDKIRYAAVVFVVGAGCTLWRYLFPGVLGQLSVQSVLFVLLNLSILPPLVYLGHLGGVIVFEGLETADQPERQGQG